MSASTHSATRLRHSKTLGALLGVHAGDSLGAALEFCSHSQIKKQYPTGLSEIIGGGVFSWPAGHATDDTDLTRAVLLAYHSRGYFQSTKRSAGPTSFDVVTCAADNLENWYNGEWPDRKRGSRPKDIGGATETGIIKYQETGDARKAGAGQGSAGNGSLMKCMPTALFTKKREDRVRESMEISAITHDDTRCTVSCAVYNEIVATLLEGKSPGKAVEGGIEVARGLGSKDVEAAVVRGIDLPLKELAERGPGKVLPDGTSGYVLQTLTVAVAALLDKRSFEDVLVDVVRLGADTDTNGAIAGGLLGARDGVEAIPDRWVRKLQFRSEFEALARDLLHE